MKETEGVPQTETVAQDPLDIATDLLLNVLVDLSASLADFKKMEAAKTVLAFTQATALLDIAKSLRTTNRTLDIIAGELERR